jgi:Concanavalin A-like lectin/glucanases superfamily
VKLYVDGADVIGSVTNLTMSDNTLPLAIGQSSSSAYFNGSIDEVALFNAPLTAMQVSAHCAAGRRRPRLPPTHPPPRSPAASKSGRR